MKPHNIIVILTACAVIAVLLPSANGAHGVYRSCAIATNGGVYCWGIGGSLGDGTTTSSSTPVAVVGLSGVISIAHGDWHTCAVLSSGSVRCWGANPTGGLGDGTTTARLTPVDVIGLSGVVSVALGHCHSCALLTTGVVKCWGCNQNRELCDGSTTSRTSPVDVVGLSSNVAKIAVGGSHACAVWSSTSVRCWGDNADGQLGDGSTSDAVAPVGVAGLSSGVAVTALGSHHSCALLISGPVQCWGRNNYGQVGDGTNIRRLTPVAVVGLSNGVLNIALGEGQSCALLLTGLVSCWGQSYGSTPILLDHLGSDFVNIAMGAVHACAITASGRVQCWGSNTNGELGSGLNSMVFARIWLEALSVAAATAAPQTPKETWSTAQLSQARYELAAASVGNMALFALGFTGSALVSYEC
jgi:alpha-tubulin suppressor-like RCC1 family protein